MDTVLTFILLAAVGIGVVLARTIDDPIGRTFEDMRGEAELQALLTPLFASRP